MEGQGERRYSSYSFTTSALDGDEWSASRTGRTVPPGKGPTGTHCTGDWVGPRVGLDTQFRGKFSCLCRGSKLDRPVVQSVARETVKYFAVYGSLASVTPFLLDRVVTDDHFSVLHYWLGCDFRLQNCSLRRWRH
jgi:hypothetical protein